MRQILLSIFIISLSCIIYCKETNTSYQELYENGYYQDAINLLNDTALQQTEDSAERENRLKILAFSYILNGNRKLAEDVFNRMLNANSGFTLDPILTSPKIYEVFSEVRQQWLMSYNSLEKEKRLTLRYRAAYHARVLPFGTGQFINGSRKKGLIFSLLQAGAIGGSIWSYKMLDASKHPDYGWYDGNREEKERYTNLTRVQFGIFASAYIWSVIDAYMEANE